MKTVKLFLIYNFTFWFFSLSEVEAQNIGINGTGANAHSSALLDVDAAPANNTGLLIPRIPLQATNLAAPVTLPATSLLVYNTSTASTGSTAVLPGYYYWDGTKWVRFQYTNGTTQDWNLLGNAGTNPTTNFLGTIDAQDLVFRTNNLEAVRITTAGNIGIGISAPTAYVHTQKVLSSTLSSGNYILKQNELINNSTLTSSGNVSSCFTRVFNNTGGILNVNAGSVIAAENDVYNNGAINAINVFGAYNSITHIGSTFSLTSEAVGSENHVLNTLGKTMNVPYSRGSVSYVSNQGILNGASSVGAIGQVINSNVFTLSAEASGGYFTIENAAGATLNTSTTRASNSVLGNEGVLKSSNAYGGDITINLGSASTTSITNELICSRNSLNNYAGATTKANSVRANFSHIYNTGNINATNDMIATHTYIDNHGSINTPYMRGLVAGVYNRSVMTATQSICALFDLHNYASSTYNGNDLIGSFSNFYNAGSLTSQFLRGSISTIYNDNTGVLNTTNQIGSGVFGITNKGSIPYTHYVYATEHLLYNRGNIHTDYARGSYNAIVNDTVGVMKSDTSYITSLIENANRGTLTVKEQAGVKINVYNTSTSNATVIKMLGLDASIQHLGPNTITDAYGITTSVSKAALGNITNSYGLYISNIQGANRWGIYQADNGANNFLAGNVGIGATTPTFKLEVIGTTACTGNVWTSDRRKKQNIQSLTVSALDIVNKLNPVTYEWKEVKDDGMKGTQMGFIAQELEQILPTMVVTTNNEEQSKGVKYNELLPVLVKAVQELSIENEKLKKQNAEVLELLKER